MKQGEEEKKTCRAKIAASPDSALSKTGTQEDKFLPLAGLAFLGMALAEGRNKRTKMLSNGYFAHKGWVFSVL